MRVLTTPLGGTIDIELGNMKDDSHIYIGTSVGEIPVPEALKKDFVRLEITSPDPEEVPNHIVLTARQALALGEALNRLADFVISTNNNIHRMASE